MQSRARSCRPLRSSVRKGNRRLRVHAGLEHPPRSAELGLFKMLGWCFVSLLYARDGSGTMQRKSAYDEAAPDLRPAAPCCEGRRLHRLKGWG